MSYKLSIVFQQQKSEVKKKYFDPYTKERTIRAHSKVRFKKIIESMVGSPGHVASYSHTQFTKLSKT